MQDPVYRNTKEMKASSENLKRISWKKETMKTITKTQKNTSTCKKKIKTNTNNAKIY